MIDLLEGPDEESDLVVFSDRNSPKISFQRNKIYYTIGEVSELLCVSDSTLRYWEKQFPEFAPKKSEGRTRYYVKKDIKNFQLLIYLLKERKFTIEGAKKLLKEDRKKIEKKHEIFMALKKIKEEIHSLRLAFDSHLELMENEGEDGFKENIT